MTLIIYYRVRYDKKGPACEKVSSIPIQISMDLFF